VVISFIHADEFNYHIPKFCSSVILVLIFQFQLKFFFFQLSVSVKLHLFFSVSITVIYFSVTVTVISQAILRRHSFALRSLHGTFN